MQETLTNQKSPRCRKEVKTWNKITAVAYEAAIDLNFLQVVSGEGYGDSLF